MTTAAVEYDDNGVTSALAKVARGLADSSAALQGLGDQAVSAATPYVPVLTGALVADLTAKVTDDQLVISAGAVVDYAAPQNSGVPSRNIPATHFFDFAENYVEQHATDDLEQAINQLIRFVGL